MLSTKKIEFFKFSTPVFIAFASALNLQPACIEYNVYRTGALTYGYVVQSTEAIPQEVALLLLLVETDPPCPECMGDH